MPSDTHRADERRFLDERGSNASLAPNGLNPATIMEKAVRERIVDSYFWKEQCFGLNEADIVDRVVSHVSFIAGTYGSTQKPSPFLCLAFKLLQLCPSDAIVSTYLSYGGEKFKYLRALACFYVRLTRKAENVYAILEPYLEDKRKLRRRMRSGVRLTFVDEFVDELLTKERVCATSLWQMPKREILEDLDLLEPRVSPLGDIEDLLDEDEDEDVNGGESEDGEVGDEGGDERRGRSGSADSSERGSRGRGGLSRNGMDVDVDGDGRSDRSRSERRGRSDSR
ncbi:PRP38 family-domain-containing protein [Xylaria bambusicola]|uniref:PRP38 family-domain-containing protein n=1 Tax=Xylaria bambusicola TaxID=326684 RepID=UPI00200861B7|nr:PRP38 family-domain-containing protein [Xylaria bambusicola]KAI0509188.1 PRP38 family-domain-containing protein [Xylaria bambusicola]